MIIYRFNNNFIFNRNRAFVKIPFNLWEKTELKGNISCKVTITLNKKLTKVYKQVINNMESINGVLLRINSSIQTNESFKIQKQD